MEQTSSSYHDLFREKDKIPPEVLPLLDILKHYGNCTQPGVDVNMMPAGVVKTDYKNEEELIAAREKYTRQLIVAEAICSGCVVQKECYQFGMRANIAGVFAGYSKGKQRERAHGPALSGKELEDFIKSSQQQFPV